MQKIGILKLSKYFKGGVNTYVIAIESIFKQKYFLKSISFNNQFPLFLYPARERVKREKQTQKRQEHEIINWYNPFSWISLNYHLRDVNILYLTWWTLPISPILLVISLVSKLQRKKIVVEFHNIIDHDASKLVTIATSMLHSILRQLTDISIVHNLNDYNKLIHLHYDRKRVRIIPHLSYDYLLMSPKSPDHFSMIELLRQKIQDKKVLLMFGLVRKYKGLEIAIEALKILIEKNKNVILLVVGESWISKTEIMAKIKELKLNDSFIWIDRYIDDSEIKSFFDLADIAIYPYLHASSSGAIQLAFASSTPVIASDVGGFKDFIVDSKNGLLCTPYSPDSLAEKIQIYLNHPDYSKKIAVVGKEYSLRNSNHRLILQMYTKIFDE